jgi:hypothetical protein
MLELICGADGGAVVRQTHKALEDRGITDPAHLELLARLLARGGQAQPAEVLAALEAPQVAQRVLAEAPVRRQAARLALGNDDAARKRVAAALPAAIGSNAQLRSDLRTDLLEAAADQLNSARTAAQAEEIAARLDRVWGAMAPPPAGARAESAAIALGRHLAASAAPAASMAPAASAAPAGQRQPPALPIRLALIGWWGRDPSAAADPTLNALTGEWLTVSPTDLAAVYASGVGTQWKTQALLSVVRRAGDVRDEVGKVIRSLPEAEHLDVCKRLAGSPELSAPLAQVLSRWTAPERFPSLLGDLMGGNGTHRRVIDDALSGMIRADGVDAVAARLSGMLPAMIAGLPDSRAVAQLCEREVTRMPLNQALASIPAGQPDLLEVILKSGQPLDPGLYDRIRCLVWLRKDLEEPPEPARTDTAELKRLAHVMKTTGAAADPHFRALILDKLCRSCTDAPAMERVLAELGTVLASDPAAALNQIVSCIARDRTLARQVDLVGAVCKVCLGGGGDPALRAQLAKSPELPFHVTRLAQVLPTATLRALDGMASGWPQPASKSWHLQTDLVRPKPMLDRSFNFLYGLGAGVLIGLLLYFAVGPLGMSIGAAAAGGLLLLTGLTNKIRASAQRRSIGSPASKPSPAQNPSPPARRVLKTPAGKKVAAP